MSLLIKALNKAEEEQARNAKTAQAQAELAKKEQADKNQDNINQPSKNQVELKIEAEVNHKLQSKIQQNPSKEVELSLSPPGSEFPENVVKPASTGNKSIGDAPVTAPSVQPTSSQHITAQSAANMFSAKGLEAKTDSARLAMIAGAGLIALLGMGLYFYQFLDSSSPISLPSRPLAQIAAPDVISANNVASKSEMASLEVTTPAIEEPATPAVSDTTEIKPTLSGTNIKKSALVNEDESLFEEEENLAEDNFAEAAALSDDKQVDNGSNRFQASFSANNVSKKTRKSRSNSTGSAYIASESASISVTKSTPPPSVNPALMSAYDAYNAGKDAEAQNLYKQVLKSDIRNVDALLGLGAIASRQGRIADANGWYGKVIEVDPGNSIAKAAMLDSNLMSNQTQGDELSNETNLKNMLAKHPGDANLYVALGNLYAEQNQWPAAQQAYFEAYSLNKTTDNAYNLAVSLDHMGKPKLALPYYMRALEQATDAGSIDKAALQARISAIQ
jgi:tetratricopeptide (TPR) repeat protein